MNILVTGGSGFIGSRLVGVLLEAGHSVKIFDKNPSKAYPELVILGDMRDAAAVCKAVAGMDVVYHLAAEHADDVRPISLYEDVNVGGAENLVKALENAGINRVIFTSSVAVYPLNAGNPDEDSEIAPFNPYGHSKNKAEEVIKGWVAKDANRSLTFVRPAVVFGEDNRGNVYNLLKQLHSKRFVMIGDGHNKKSMGYVGNIVKFLEFCMKLDNGLHVFNYADKPDLSTAELVTIANKAFGRAENSHLKMPYWFGIMGGCMLDVVARITGKKFPISAIRIKKFCSDTTVSADRVAKTGFKAPFSFTEAFNRTIKSEF